MSPITETGQRLAGGVDGWIAHDDNDIPIPVSVDAMATAVGMVEAEAAYRFRWEPVYGDCTRHEGPHVGFRCNGAVGRLVAK